MGSVMVKRAGGHSLLSVPSNAALRLQDSPLLSILVFRIFGAGFGLDRTGLSRGRAVP
jgi:hypothetical protein